jgi:hypothetical protein
VGEQKERREGEVKGGRGGLYILLKAGLVSLYNISYSKNKTKKNGSIYYQILQEYLSRSKSGAQLGIEPRL